MFCNEKPKCYIYVKKTKCDTTPSPSPSPSPTPRINLPLHRSGYSDSGSKLLPNANDPFYKVTNIHSGSTNTQYNIPMVVVRDGVIKTPMTLKLRDTVTISSTFTTARGYEDKTVDFNGLPIENILEHFEITNVRINGIEMDPKVNRVKLNSTDNTIEFHIEYTKQDPTNPTEENVMIKIITLV